MKIRTLLLSVVTLFFITAAMRPLQAMQQQKQQELINNAMLQIQMQILKEKLKSLEAQQNSKETLNQAVTMDEKGEGWLKTN